MRESDSISTRPPLRELLRNYLGANNAVFLQHVQSPGLPQNTIGIHQLRVSTKRIRSLFRLMEWLAPERLDARHALRAMRRFFKLAGSIRDLQIRAQLLDDYCSRLGLSFPRYESAIRAARVKAQRKLRRKLPDFSPDMVKGPSAILLEVVTHFDEETILQSAQQNVALRMEEIALQMPPEDDAERLHGVRILLKENLYVIALLNESATEPIWSKQAVNALKEAAELAGDWHDLDVFLEALRLHRTAHPKHFPDEAKFLALTRMLDQDRSKALRQYRKQVKQVLAGHVGQHSPPTPDTPE